MSERRGPFPWPPKPVYRAGGYSATPRPAEGVITWNINTTCNYRCSYCTQRFLDDRGRWAKETPAFLDAFSKKLPGRWEIKISGGEPFQHPTLFEIVEGLRARGHWVSVVTNLSASPEKLARFLSTAGESLRVFSASLHLEYVDSEAALAGFANKILQVQAGLPAGGSANVTCVATRANLPRLSELWGYFTLRGIRCKFQPEKQGREVIDYSPEERALLLSFGGHNGLGEVTFDFSGRPCWAGAASFTLDDRGDAWRCYPARRFRSQYLGNLLRDDFVLARGPSPCLYEYCNCTVPIERGMMPKEAPSDTGSLPPKDKRS